MTHVHSPLREHRVCIVLAIAAGAAAAVVWFGMPHSRDIPNVGVLLIKLVPFVLAVEAIARMALGERARRIVAAVAMPVCFLVYFGNFVPRMFFANNQGASIYYLLLTVTPFLILSMVLAYRLGGGSSGMTRRLGYAMILLQLSGLEDLAYITLNPQTDPEFTSIPAVWTWADHMTVFLGRPLTKNEAFVFIAIHVVLAVLVLVLPDRFWRRLIGRTERAAARPVPDAVSPVDRMESV
jgi:hypothetical protein